MGLKISKIGRLLPLIVLVFFLGAYFIPGGKESGMVKTTLGVVGLLFGVLVGLDRKSVV